MAHFCGQFGHDLLAQIILLRFIDFPGYILDPETQVIEENLKPELPVLVGDSHDHVVTGLTKAVHGTQVTVVSGSVGSAWVHTHVDMAVSPEANLLDQFDAVWL